MDLSKHFGIEREKIVVTKGFHPQVSCWSLYGAISRFCGLWNSQNYHTSSTVCYILSSIVFLARIILTSMNSSKRDRFVLRPKSCDVICCNDTNMMMMHEGNRLLHQLIASCIDSRIQVASTNGLSEEWIKRKSQCVVETMVFEIGGCFLEQVEERTPGALAWRSLDFGRSVEVVKAMLLQVFIDELGQLHRLIQNIVSESESSLLTTQNAASTADAPPSSAPLQMGRERAKRDTLDVLISNNDKDAAKRFNVSAGNQVFRKICEEYAFAVPHWLLEDESALPSWSRLLGRLVIQSFQVDFNCRFLECISTSEGKQNWRDVSEEEAVDLAGMCVKVIAKKQKGTEVNDIHYFGMPKDKQEPDIDTFVSLSEKIIPLLSANSSTIKALLASGCPPDQHHLDRISVRSSLKLIERMIWLAMSARNVEERAKSVSEKITDDAAPAGETTNDSCSEDQKTFESMIVFFAPKLLPAARHPPPVIMTSEDVLHYDKKFRTNEGKHVRLELNRLVVNETEYSIKSAKDKNIGESKEPSTALGATNKANQISPLARRGIVSVESTPVVQNTDPSRPGDLNGRPLEITNTPKTRL
jgi:hypothetical protein